MFVLRKHLKTIWLSFPRAAWECSQHRAAVLRRGERRWVTVQDLSFVPSHDAAWAACDRSAVTNCIPTRRVGTRKHLQQLDPNQEVVAYCRGPHCVLAFDAVAKLRDSGINARRLEDGFPEWKGAKLPVESC